MGWHGKRNGRIDVYAERYLEPVRAGVEDGTPVIMIRGKRYHVKGHLVETDDGFAVLRGTELISITDSKEEIYVLS